MTIELQGFIRFRDNGALTYTGSCPDGTAIATPLVEIIQEACREYVGVDMKTAKVTIQIEPQ
jgi:hypothetical protein